NDFMRQHSIMVIRSDMTTGIFYVGNPVVEVIVKVAEINTLIAPGPHTPRIVILLVILKIKAEAVAKCFSNEQPVIVIVVQRLLQRVVNGHKHTGAVMMLRGTKPVVVEVGAGEAGCRCGQE